eukprot:238684-Chlamydomonas_euryale.AAC.1
MRRLTHRVVEQARRIHGTLVRVLQRGARNHSRQPEVCQLELRARATVGEQKVLGLQVPAVQQASKSTGKQKRG